MKIDIMGIASTTIGLANLGINTASNYTVHKQAKTNMYVTIGTHVILVMLATGISAWQTSKLIKEIRKETYEGSNE